MSRPMLVFFLPIIAIVYPIRTVFSKTSPTTVITENSSNKTLTPTRPTPTEVSQSEPEEPSEEEKKNLNEGDCIDI